jgi:hypothetical protein
VNPNAAPSIRPRFAAKRPCMVASLGSGLALVCHTVPIGQFHNAVEGFVG